MVLRLESIRIYAANVPMYSFLFFFFSYPFLSFSVSVFFLHVVSWFVLFFSFFFTHSVSSIFNQKVSATRVLTFLIWKCVPVSISGKTTFHFNMCTCFFFLSILCNRLHCIINACDHLELASLKITILLSNQWRWWWCCCWWQIIKIANYDPSHWMRMPVGHFQFFSLIFILSFIIHITIIIFFYSYHLNWIF